MVGLVIVSHSNALSQSLVGLVRQVAATQIPLCGVGGVGVDKNEFGTDAFDIVEAIESVYSPDGVVVLMDLGSAILSAETALELLPEEMRPRIRVCGAPIVEGAVAAGVQISLGAGLDAVCHEAARALIPKIKHLSVPDEKIVEPWIQEPADAQAEEWQALHLTVGTPHGLHARPAARFVQTAAAFDAQIRVKKLESTAEPVPATSLNSIATLGIRQGERIVVFARGTQAKQALAAVKTLVDDELPKLTAQFVTPPPTDIEEPHGKVGIAAVAVSDGYAAGPLYHYRISLPQISRHQAENPVQEWKHLEQARDNASRSILNRRHSVESRLGKAQAAIFDAHLLIIQDPKLLDAVRSRIFQKKQNAAAAWHESVQQIVDAYRALSDDYLKQRAADVIDVGTQVLLNILGQNLLKTVALSQPAILVAEELTPTDTAVLDTRKVLGMVTVKGGPTSHTATLARTLGIPAVAGVDPSLLNLPDNTSLALDGFRGTLWVEPGPDVCEELKKRRARWLQKRRRLRKNSRQPAVTIDGRRLSISANVGNVAGAQFALENGADGVGLLRTEFLYLTRSEPPSEAEQVDILRQIGSKIAGRPICVRTLDVGGDKSIAYLRLPAEANPYLGVRGVRLSLRHPELFRGQLRAILLAGADFDLRVMFPMISTIEEIDRVLETLEAVHRELVNDNIAHRWPILTGAMIETPAAVLMMSSFVKRLDFFSIGTNDLTQYCLAAERGNSNLADYADALHPAILQQIKKVVDEAHRQAKHVAVCGELAADLVAVPALVGLGVDELSLAPDAIPEVKALIGRLACDTTVDLADKMMTAASAADARKLAEKFLRNLTEKSRL
ncbi:MAG: phosphoenolpyruvate--protein phosphotransferase [Desulfobacterales bacterium]|nr:MAG: phosphoenolpyruvate--protein phosphotransferase [Desulfobacterales bacterium]